MVRGTTTELLLSLPAQGVLRTCIRFVLFEPHRRHSASTSRVPSPTACWSPPSSARRGLAALPTGDAGPGPAFDARFTFRAPPAGTARRLRRHGPCTRGPVHRLRGANGMGGGGDGGAALRRRGGGSRARRLPCASAARAGRSLRVKPTVSNFPFAPPSTCSPTNQRGLGQERPAARGPIRMATMPDDAAGVIRMGRLGSRWACSGHPSAGHGCPGAGAPTPGARRPALGLACTSSGGAGGSSYPLHELAGLDRARVRRARTRTGRKTPAWADPGLRRTRGGGPLRATGGPRRRRRAPGDLLPARSTLPPTTTWERPAPRCAGPGPRLRGPLRRPGPPPEKRPRPRRTHSPVPGSPEFFDGGHCPSSSKTPCAIGAIGEFLPGRRELGGERVEAGGPAPVARPVRPRVYGGPTKIPSSALGRGAGEPALADRPPGRLPVRHAHRRGPRSTNAINVATKAPRPAVRPGRPTRRSSPRARAPPRTSAPVFIDAPLTGAPMRPARAM